MKLAICVVSNRDWKASFGTSLVMLIQYLSRRGSCGKRLEQMSFHPRIQASLLMKGRRLVLEDAIEAGATHALCLDDDMVFPENALDYLPRTDAAMVAANYQSRNHAGQGVGVTLDGQRVTSKGKTGQERIDRIGFGLALLDLSYLQRMAQPWFAVPWIPEVQEEMGEDYYFCMQLKKLGGAIYVDHDVSNNVQHLSETALVTP